MRVRTPKLLVCVLCLGGTLCLAGATAGVAQGADAAVTSLTAGAPPVGTPTAWEALRLSDPAAAATADALTRSILTRLSPESYTLLQAGTPASEISLIDGRNLAAFLAEVAGVGPGFAIPFFTIDGGGAPISTGGTFELEGTIGQPDAGSLISGDQTLIVLGGFREQLGPLIFEDGFESGTTDEWSSTVP